MNELIELLNGRWVIKKNDPDKYFKVKDKLKHYQDFVKEKLGYAIIINPLMIKIEKIAGNPLPWMGITSFDDPICYVFLCYLLMFLEEKEPEEQFVLAQVTDFIQSQRDMQETVDWTEYTQRKRLIKVLEFSKENHLIQINDGDDSAFISEKDSVEVLYENTGLSKYFMRRFPFDITDVQTTKALERLDWQNDDGDRGLVRRHRVYRRLVLEPVVYQNGLEDQDYLYIKNMRSVLAHDFEHFLDADLHVHKNGAMLFFGDQAKVKDALPNRKNISDIIFQCCKEIRHKVNGGEWTRQSDDTIDLSNVKWDMFLEDIQKKYGSGWSKGYRELSLKALKMEINDVLIGFGLIQMALEHNTVKIMPVAGKISGDYPREFWEKQKENLTNVVED